MVSEESACCCSRGYGGLDLQCGHLPEMEANGEGKVVVSVNSRHHEEGP